MQVTYEAKHAVAKTGVVAQQTAMSTTGDASDLLGETFVTGGTVLVAAGVFPSDKHCQLIRWGRRKADHFRRAAGDTNPAARCYLREDFQLCPRGAGDLISRLGLSRRRESKQRPSKELDTNE